MNRADQTIYWAADQPPAQPETMHMTMLSTDEQAPHIAAIRHSVLAGFRFLHLRDTSQQIIAINAERVRGGTVETFTIRAMHEALAGRFRTDDYPAGDPVWQQHGTAADVITALLDLPPPDSPQAPTRTLRRPSGLWLPGQR
ncbi:hypothetical protein IQ251_00810 [Saccharopolyspora sp. HNM0983]|uniref:Uncharacterized protein n=1 Tax=Saccharopolyspora montiporae TaxID=2781240 RepID=A0A929B4E9_9PSEU|nr:hypothetical protein [Saccharopolyspora sp. HNM0983]MBE9372977.1 hypothetical protein [Saccharopolyspora sp. HNM0983]